MEGNRRLKALEAQGCICKEGDLCTQFLLEVRGGRLHLGGREALEARDGGVLPRREYHYLLEAPEAERLLEALSREYGGSPAQALQSLFEFGNPRNPLRDYLEDHGIAFSLREERVTI